MTPVRLGEPGKGQDLGGGFIEMAGGVDETDPTEVVDDTAMLGPHRFGIGLSEHGIRGMAQRPVPDIRCVRVGRRCRKMYGFSG